MPLTVEHLASSESKHTHRHRDESAEKYVARLTHVTCPNQRVQHLENLRYCKNATTLFLYDNLISSMDGIQYCKKLTHLCLQHNRISRMAFLTGLPMLRRLRLGYNEISVVEGLDNCTNLEELHVEHQRLLEGEQLIFDPRSIAGIAKSLIVLNSAGNNLTDVMELNKLQSLQRLNLSENKLTDLGDLDKVIINNGTLLILWIERNPLCNQPKFIEHIIGMSLSLKMLNGKEIPEITRKFLYHMKHKLPSSGRERGWTPQLASEDEFGARTPKFPSRLSGQNPHWLPPLPSKRSVAK